MYFTGKQLYEKWVELSDSSADPWKDLDQSFRDSWIRLAAWLFVK